MTRSEKKERVQEKVKRGEMEKRRGRREEEEDWQQQESFVKTVMGTKMKQIRLPAL